MIELVAHLCDIPDRDHRCNIIFLQIRDLGIGKEAAKLSILQGKYLTKLPNRHKYRNALTLFINARHFECILFVFIFLIQRYCIAFGQVILFTEWLCDINLSLFQGRKSVDLHIPAVIFDAINGYFFIKSITFLLQRCHIKLLRIRIVCRDRIAILVLIIGQHILIFCKHHAFGVILIILQGTWHTDRHGK